MTIDIDKLDREDLIDLNRRIVERLKFLDTYDAHREMMRFNIGDRVRVDLPGRGEQVGTLIKYNKKTVSIMIGNEQWNVSPHFLKTIESKANVVDLKPVKTNNN